MLDNQTCYDCQQQKKKRKKHINYLDFSKYFLILAP